MFSFTFLDAAPDPVGLGIIAVVVVLVIGFIILLAAGLVVFLWLRKRSMRFQEMKPLQEAANLSTNSQSR